MKCLGQLTPEKSLCCVDPRCKNTPSMLRHRGVQWIRDKSGAPWEGHYAVCAYQVCCTCGWRGPSKRRKWQALAAWLLVMSK